MGKLKTCGDNGDSKDIDWNEVIKAQKRLARGAQKIERLNEGEKLKIAVMPAHFGSLNLGYRVCEAVVLRKYPRYILLDMGKYKVCASRIALIRKEYITV